MGTVCRTGHRFTIARLGKEELLSWMLSRLINRKLRDLNHTNRIIHTKGEEIGSGDRCEIDHRSRHSDGTEWNWITEKFRARNS